MSNIIYMDKNIIIREHDVGDWFVTDRSNNHTYRWASGVPLDNNEIIDQSRWLIADAIATYKVEDKQSIERILDVALPKHKHDVCPHCMGYGRVKTSTRV